MSRTIPYSTLITIIIALALLISIAFNIWTKEIPAAKLLYFLFFFYQLLSCPETKFGPLLSRQSEWENNSGKLQIVSGKFQNNAINEVKQIPLSYVIIVKNSVTFKKSDRVKDEKF